MPNKWMLVDYGKELRKFMATTSLQQILNFGDIQFFADATTYTCIFVTKKSQTKNNVLALSLNKKTYNGDFLQEIPNALQEFPNELFGENEWKIIDNISLKVLEKINTFTPLKSLPIEIYRGILTGFDEAFQHQGHPSGRGADRADKVRQAPEKAPPGVFHPGLRRRWRAVFLLNRNKSSPDFPESFSL